MKNKITVTELPMGLWTSKFILWCQEQPCLNFKDYSTVDTVQVELVVTPEFKIADLDKVLTVVIYLRNMVTFTKDNVIQRVTLQEIFDQWGWERLALYHKRKAHRLEELTTKLQDQNLTLRLITLVQDKKVNMFDPEAKIKKDFTREFNGDIEAPLNKLLNLPVRSFSQDKITRIKGIIKSLTEEVAQLKATTPENLWQDDLERFSAAW